MKLELNIHKLAKSRGINTAYQLQKNANLTPTNASKLFNNESTQISVETLGKLCEALKCKPNDLFVVPEINKDPKPKTKN